MRRFKLERTVLASFVCKIAFCASARWKIYFSVTKSQQAKLLTRKKAPLLSSFMTATLKSWNHLFLKSYKLAILVEELLVLQSKFYPFGARHCCREVEYFAGTPMSRLTEDHLFTLFVVSLSDLICVLSFQFYLNERYERWKRKLEAKLRFYLTLICFLCYSLRQNLLMMLV